MKTIEENTQRKDNPNLGLGLVRVRHNKRIYTRDISLFLSHNKKRENQKKTNITEKEKNKKKREKKNKNMKTK